MGKSEKKQFLQGYKWIVARIEAINVELDKPVYDYVKFKGEKAEKDAVKHVSKGERLLAERNGLEKKKKAIEDAVAAVKDNRESILLNSVYISGKSAIEVSHDMGISVRTVYRILDAAIDSVQI